MPHHDRHKNYCQQHGAALMLMLILLVIGAATLLVSSLSRSAPQIERSLKTADALALAKAALIGNAVSQTSITSAGYLLLPDIGFGPPGITPSEGNAAPNFGGNGKDFSVVGKLPWRTLGLEALRDGAGECLWYAVSGRFKNSPTTDAFNWDTLGQINLADGSGNIIGSNLAALVVAPGYPLDGQNRVLSDPAYAQCGGNYDARNYLDPHVSTHDSTDAIFGAVNYFSGSTNNRVALDSGNKLVIMSENIHYNDRFLFITTDEIFRVVMRRADFSVQVSALLSDAYFQSVVIAGTKGTNNVNCNFLGSGNQTFCKNWKEMLLLTQLPASAPITLDGITTADCTRVLIFGGQKNVDQFRLTAADKAKPSNYIEGINLSAFATPVAAAGTLGGVSVFSAKQPSADVLKCLS